MKRIVKFQQVLFLLLFAVMTMAFMPYAVLAQAENNEPVSSPILLNAQATKVQAYWTEERMLNAIPMPMPELSELETKAQEEVVPPGPMVIANSGEPSVRAESTEEPRGGTYPFSYTRYRLFPNRVGQYKKFPYKATGKLFFTIPGQGIFVCSGASLNSENKSVVWTAGHCVYTPGVGFHTNFLFAPARRQGVNPYGTWTVKQAFTLVGWTNGLYEYDHGALVMKLGGNNNQKIGDAIGFLGFIASVSRKQHWHIHGYPQAPRDLPSTPPGAQFDGEHHEICVATWATDDQPTGTQGVDPQTIGIGCDQTSGTSGAPWVIDFSGFKSGLNNLLNGNNSYRYQGGPPNNLRVYSPYFTDGAVNLRDAAQRVPVP